MVLALNKRLKKSVVMVMLIAVLFVFLSPTLALASSTIPNVEIGTDGTVTVKGDGFGDGSTATGWAGIIVKYRAFIAGFAGLAAITMVVIFIINFLKLGSTAGNPTGRTQALMGLLWSGIAAAGLGAVSVIVGLFYNAI